MEEKRIYYYNNKDKYIGYWKNNKKEGKGKIIYIEKVEKVKVYGKKMKGFLLKLQKLKMENIMVKGQ